MPSYLRYREEGAGGRCASPLVGDGARTPVGGAAAAAAAAAAGCRRWRGQTLASVALAAQEGANARFVQRSDAVRRIFAAATPGRVAPTFSPAPDALPSSAAAASALATLQRRFLDGGDSSMQASFSMQTRRGGVHVTPNSGGGAGAHAAAAMSYRSLATPAALARTRALEPFFRVDRSGVHGMGVFTTVALPGREMIMEYKGEIVRRPIADRREAAERAAIARRAKDAADSAARRGDPPPPPLSEVRSISHWFPNDRVGVVNADP